MDFKDIKYSGKGFDGFLSAMEAYIKERYLVIPSSHVETISDFDTSIELCCECLSCC